MKALLIILCISCAGALAADPPGRLPPPDPTRPLYQKRWGGTVIAWPIGDVDRVAWPRPETLADAKLRIKIQELEGNARVQMQLRQSGRRRFELGITGMVAGVILMVILAHWGFELFGLAIAVIGGGAIIDGAIKLQLAGHLRAVAIGGGILLVLGVIFAFTHGRGIRVKATANALKAVAKNGAQIRRLTEDT